MYDLLKPSDMANFLNCLCTCGDCQIICMYVFSLAFFAHVVGFLLSSEAPLLYLLDFSAKLFIIHTLALLEFQFIVNWFGVIINYF